LSKCDVEYYKHKKFSALKKNIINFKGQQKVMVGRERNGKDSSSHASAMKTIYINNYRNVNKC
jgi:hypothetical protein